MSVWVNMLRNLVPKSAPPTHARKRPRLLVALVASATFAATLAGGVASPGSQPAQAQIDAAPSAVIAATATDESNSINAERLVDGATGTSTAAAWQNPSPWRADSYPMTALLDLGGSYDLSGLEYFVGNLTQGQDRVSFEVSSEASGENFVPLVTISDGHQWNHWRTVDATSNSTRRVRIRFGDRHQRFNISEIRFSGTPSGGGGGDGDGDGDGDGGGGNPGDQPRSDVPGSSIVRSAGFGSFPSSHLSPTCVSLHNRYWVQGPGAKTGSNPNASENKAYHTWHPAITTHPDTSETCDFGHEHGTNPSHASAEVFELSGGWPAFGYAADVAAAAGGARHEDHVGHKVTVARFRAAIGNTAGSEPIYDAGFECNWLSKIHQGSSSLDAFANHLHEYYLTLQCADGLNAAGQMDGQTIGTSFSVKVMYTYGNPNEFNEVNCAGSDIANTPANEQTFDIGILTGPEGQSIPHAHQLSPTGNHSPNNREFVCASGVIYKSMEEVSQVDLWTEVIEIKRPNGHSAVMLQPYYIVKNPARIIEGYDRSLGEQPSRVVRTIDLCYGPNGLLDGLDFCQGAPAANPGWQSPASPFNGTLRAINFKSAPVQNDGGPPTFCTSASGLAVQDVPDEDGQCQPGNILQTVAPFDNNWNNGRYSYQGRSGNVQGSIWAQAPNGDFFASPPLGGGAYDPLGLGFEFLVDNRDPDDDLNGQSDGAHIRGEN